MKRVTWPHWRKTTRKGERVLIDPDGRIYHGTAQEIREAALMPGRRDALANELRWARETLRHFPDWTPEERRGYIREKRMDAIDANHLDMVVDKSIHMSADVFLLLQAGSRLVRGDDESFEEYLAGLFRSELDALLDVAHSETGRREIPLTRYERAALDRLRLKKPKDVATA